MRPRSTRLKLQYPIKGDFESKKASNIADRFFETLGEFGDIRSPRRLIGELVSASKIEAPDEIRAHQSKRMADELNKLDFPNYPGLGTLFPNLRLSV